MLTLARSAGIDRTKQELALLFDKEFDWLVVAEEHHQDGDIHHHILGFKNDGYPSRGTAVLSRFRALLKPGESLNVKHTDGPKGLLNFLKYVLKEDPNPVEVRIDVKAELKRAEAHVGKKTDLLARRALEGASLGDLIAEDPGFALLHSRAIKDFLNAIRDAGLRKSAPKARRIIHVYGIPLEFHSDRPFRTKQLYITGDTSTGKTSELMKLIRDPDLIGSAVPTNNDWAYFNPDSDFVYIDDFNDESLGHGRIPWSTLLALMDGAPVQLNVKGSSIKFSRNVPVIIISNQSPEVVLASRPEVEKRAFLSRVAVLVATGPPHWDFVHVAGELPPEPAAPVEGGVPEPPPGPPPGPSPSSTDGSMDWAYDLEMPTPWE